MVDEDPPIVIDDREFESAREHRLAVGEQHLPAERHNVATETGGRGGAIANTLAPGALSRRGEGELGERSVSARSRAAHGVWGPQRGNGGRAFGRVWLVPRSDIAIGERLRIEHHVSPVWLRRSRACEPSNSCAKMALVGASIHDFT